LKFIQSSASLRQRQARRACSDYWRTAPRLQTFLQEYPMLIKTIRTDSLQTSIDGFDFTANNEIFTVAANIIIESQNFNGIFSSNSNSILINQGQIISVNHWGIVFNENNGILTNAACALISGLTGGAALGGRHDPVLQSSTGSTRLR
jgi:hypothetical protein